MSASTRISRLNTLRPSQSPSREGRSAWIGIDLSGAERPRSTRMLIPLLILTLIASLGVAGNHKLVEQQKWIECVQNPCPDRAMHGYTDAFRRRLGFELFSYFS